MNAESIVHSLRIVELPGSSRQSALRQLVAAGRWTDHGLSDVEVLERIEERENTAQTIVAEGLAIPHASVDWNGDFRIMLGRSRTGIQYGAAGDLVNLIVLVITGRNQSTLHLDILSTLGTIFKASEFRRALTEARDVAEIGRLLREKVGSAGPRPERSAYPQISSEIVKHAVELAVSLRVPSLLLVVDGIDAVPWDILTRWRGRVLIVASDADDGFRAERPDTHVFGVPHSRLSRLDRANLGLLLAGCNGLLADQTDVVCVTGLPGRRLDCVAVMSPYDKLHAVFRGRAGHASLEQIPPMVILRALSLAIEIAAEGREGQAVGALFVIGDSRRVRQRARQLVLNPFHGFSRQLRSILDPGLAETIKEFASLDGAFIVESDGTVFSAGTYVSPDATVDGLPGGLGARHQAAVSITADTNALAISVSQSTGAVTVFHMGESIMTLERASLTRW